MDGLLCLYPHYFGWSFIKDFDGAATELPLHLKVSSLGLFRLQCFTKACRTSANLLDCARHTYDIQDLK